MSDVIEVEGIGEVYAQKLKQAGIATGESRPEEGAARTGREKLAQATGISEKPILRWVNHVDLFWIKGVQAQYAGLLEAAEVDSVPELVQRNPANLHPALAGVNQEKNLVRKLTTAEQVADWVGQAKTLPRVVTH